MSRFGRLPVARKLAVLMTAAGALAVLVACGAFLLRDRATQRRATAGELSTLAEVTARTCGAALGLGDRATVEQQLDALGVHPDVVGAWVLDARGAVFASYRRPGAAAGEPPGPGGGGGEADPRFGANRLEIWRPVAFGGEPLGQVVIRAGLGGLRARLRQDAWVVGGVLLVSILLAYAVSLVLQRAVSRPIEGLVATVRRVAEAGDYSARAPAGAADELGELAAGFNGILAQIQERGERLARLATAVDQAAEAVVIIDLRGVVQYVNPAFERMTGYTPAEAAGQELRLLQAGRADEETYRARWAALGRGEVWS
ncbi:MAG: CHASE sensor domain-containing protein, partial [Deferrisomatales bacterium]